MRANVDVIEINTDSSAALGIGGRRGLGKVRHVALNQLWIQDKVANGEIMLVKCKGSKKPADILTTHLHVDGIAYPHVHVFCRVRGRASPDGPGIMR